MNKRLASLLVIASLSLAAMPALAQDVAQDVAPAPGASACQHGHGRRGGGPLSAEAMEHRITRMTERLSLDANQVSLVREIFTSARTQAEALRTGTPGPERREQFHALMQATRGRVDAILTDAQRTQFAQMQQHMRERMQHHGRRGGHRGTPPAADTRGI